MVVDEAPASPRARLLHALLVHVEPLAEGARVLVLGDDPGVVERLRELGARHVQVDASGEGLDVREGAFDLAIVSDLGTMTDPALAVRRLRRLVAPGGAVVALARARTEAGEERVETFPEIAPPAVGYAELYDLFALQFENVTMSGVLPFEGIVFAQLGTEDDVAVGVDARLVTPPSPDVFVVVASRDPVDLDPYAIVQVPEVSREPSGEERRAAEATLAAAILESKILAAQLEEQRARNAHMDARSGETVQRLEALMAERDAAQARVAELEALAEAARDALGAVERRLLSAEQAILERDDTIAALKGELDALRAEGEELASVDPALLDELAARAERAESALALNVADLARVAEAHAAETAALEAQLRERAKVIASMEKELARREQIVRELVTALEEAREGIVEQPRLLEAAPPTDPEETARLTKKIDDLALEIARREGELVAQAWRIEELENDRAPRGGSTPAAPDPELARELARTKDEIDALRQALTQEHAARVAAESGEELVRVRAELAQKAALLEQMKTRGAHPSDGIE